MPRVQMTPGNIVFSTSAVLNFHWARLLMGDRRLDMVGWSLLKVELHFIHRIRCSEMVPQIKPHFFNRKNTALFLYPIVNVKKATWYNDDLALIKPAATGQQFSLDVVVRRGADQINPLRLVQMWRKGRRLESLVSIYQRLQWPAKNVYGMIYMEVSSILINRIFPY